MLHANPSTIVLVASDGAAASRTVMLDLDERSARARWATQLDAAFRNDGEGRDEPAGVIALADGLAAVALAYWMQLSPRSYLAGLRGAVLRAPAADAACAAVGLGTLPATRLPVPTIVVGRAGEDAARHLSLADRWGARFVPEHQLARTLAADALEERLLDLARSGPEAAHPLLAVGAQVVPLHARDPD